MEPAPSAVVAEGVHQTLGPCYVHDVDLSNYSRFKYLCATDYDEDYTLGGCGGVPPATRATAKRLADPSWHTLCGKAHSDKPAYVAAALALCVAAAAALGAMLLPPMANGKVGGKKRA